MSYTLLHTDGSILTQIVDGTIDQTATDLTLIGKNSVAYGTFINENFLYLLENFANHYTSWAHQKKSWNTKKWKNVEISIIFIDEGIWQYWYINQDPHTKQYVSPEEFIDYIISQL